MTRHELAYILAWPLLALFAIDPWGLGGVVLGVAFFIVLRLLRA